MSQPQYKPVIKIRVSQMATIKLYGKTLPQLRIPSSTARGIAPSNRPARLVKPPRVEPFNSLRIRKD